MRPRPRRPAERGPAVPGSAPARALLTAFGRPLAGPSANRSGRVSRRGPPMSSKISADASARCSTGATRRLVSNPPSSPVSADDHGCCAPAASPGSRCRPSSARHRPGPRPPTRRPRWGRACSPRITRRMPASASTRPGSSRARRCCCSALSDRKAGSEPPPASTSARRGRGRGGSPAVREPARSRRHGGRHDRRHADPIGGAGRGDPRQVGTGGRPPLIFRNREGTTLGRFRYWFRKTTQPPYGLQPFQARSNPSLFSWAGPVFAPRLSTGEGVGRGKPVSEIGQRVVRVRA